MLIKILILAEYFYVHIMCLEGKVQGNAEVTE